MHRPNIANSRAGFLSDLHCIPDGIRDILYASSVTWIQDGSRSSKVKDDDNNRQHMGDFVFDVY